MSLQQWLQKRVVGSSEDKRVSELGWREGAEGKAVVSVENPRTELVAARACYLEEVTS